MPEIQQNNHSIKVEARKTISISGVDSVSAFSEVKISLKLLGGEKLYVVGTELKITGFSKANGTFTAEGNVSGFSYGGKSFAAKIFK